MTLDESIVQLLTAIALALLTWGLNTFKNWVTLKIAESKDASLIKYVTLAQDVVEKVVIYLNQTVVVDLKKESEDGHLTSEEAKAVMDKAVKEIHVLIGSEMKTAVETLYGDFDVWLITMIEAFVSAEKNKNVYKV